MRPEGKKPYLSREQELAYARGMTRLLERRGYPELAKTYAVDADTLAKVPAMREPVTSWARRGWAEDWFLRLPDTVTPRAAA